VRLRVPAFFRVSSCVRTHLDRKDTTIQRLQLLDIEHHEVLAGTSVSMAPGYEDSGKLEHAKSSAGYWTHAKAGAQAPTRGIVRSTKV
jgi:hypothetical protein